MMIYTHYKLYKLLKKQFFNVSIKIAREVQNDFEQNSFHHKRNLSPSIHCKSNHFK